MKTEVQFLRETAAKLKQQRYEHNLSMSEWKETIFCQVEFLIIADEIENHYKPPRTIIEQQLPKARPLQKEFVSFVGVKFQRREEESIAAPRAQRQLEPLQVEQKKELLILKDLPSKKSLILKDLVNVESVNVLRDVEIKLLTEKPYKLLKTKSYSIKRPDRAPQIKKEEEVSLDRLVKLQRGRCAYCFRRFGDRVFSKRKIVTLNATREHFIPESMGGQIIFAACQMCNFFKRDYLFDSIFKCRKYLAGAWERSGYKDANGHFLADSQQFSKN